MPNPEVHIDGIERHELGGDNSLAGRETRFIQFPIPGDTGYQLRLEPDITSSGQRRLLSNDNLEVIKDLTEVFAKRHQEIRVLLAEEKENGDELKDIAENYPGFAGAVVEGKDGVYVITIVKQTRVLSWDRDLLKQALGPSYYNFVNEDTVIKVSSFMNKYGNFVTPEEIYKVFAEALKNHGIEPEQLSQVTRFDVDLRVDENGGKSWLAKQGKEDRFDKARETKTIFAIRSEVIPTKEVSRELVDIERSKSF